MKKKCFRTIISLMLLISFNHPTFSQTCYTIYKTQGDNYKIKAESPNQADSYRRQNYTLAKQQYQFARNCSYLTNTQRAALDQLLAEVSSKLVSPKVITTIKRNFGS